MSTLILSQRYTDDARLLEAAARRAGIGVYKMKGSDLRGINPEDDLLIYCEGFTAEYVSQQLDVVILRPLLDSLAKVSPNYLSRKVTCLSKKELTEEMFPAFLKPVDQKFFEAGVYPSLSQVHALSGCPESEPVFISDIIEISDEYRFFCRDGHVMTGAPYFQKGEFVGESAPEISSSDSAWTFAQDVLGSVGDLVPPGSSWTLQDLRMVHFA